METKQIQTRCMQYAFPENPEGKEREFSVSHFGKTFSFQVSLNDFVTGIELLVSSSVISEETFGDKSKRVAGLSGDDLLNIFTPLTVYWRNNEFPETLDEFQEQCLFVLKEKNVLVGGNS